MLIIIAKENANVQGLQKWLKSLGVQSQVEEKGDFFVLECKGDVWAVDDRLCNAFGKTHVVREQRLPKQTNLKVQVKVGQGQSQVAFGGGEIVHIAGPCTIEQTQTEEQLFQLASTLKQSGAKVLRGGAFKPRTSPYTFQGMEKRGIELLCSVAKKTQMVTISEIMSINQLDVFESVDILQVGAKNMFNYQLLKELSKCAKPVLLKRNPTASINEWLFAAEYLLQSNGQVILCERGVRTVTGDTCIDIGALVQLRQQTGLPVVADITHAAASQHKAMFFARAAASCNVDGIMAEVTTCPEQSVCDGVQSLTTAQYPIVVKEVDAVVKALERVR